MKSEVLVLNNLFVKCVRNVPCFRQYPLPAVTCESKVCITSRQQLCSWAYLKRAAAQGIITELGSACFLIFTLLGVRPPGSEMLLNPELPCGCKPNGS